MSEIKRKRVAQLLCETPGVEVLAKGWVRTKRGNKNVAFIALNDGSTVNNIQVVCDAALFSYELCSSCDSFLVLVIGNANSTHCNTPCVYFLFFGATIHLLSTSFSARMYSLSCGTWMRTARILICRALSSPLT